MRDPDVKEKLASQGDDADRRHAGAFCAAFIGSEIRKWAEVIKDAGVQTEK